MLQYFAIQLIPYVNVFNLFTYNTVRAAGAAATAFALCLLLGPFIIRRLRALKIGQYIKKEHVQDLHKLHQGKAGTPTMGGVMIILSTVIALGLWGTLSNRLLIVAVIVLVLLGAVGFIDDYIKLRRKHNDGLSARAKFTGQILAGLILGGYVMYNPVTPSVPYVRGKDVDNYEGIARVLARPEAPETGVAGGATGGAAEGATGGAAEVFWEALSPELRGMLLRSLAQGAIPEITRRQLLLELNSVLERPSLFPELALHAGTPAAEVVEVNRRRLESITPDIAPFSAHPQTDVGIPGLKNVLIPLGVLYLVFVIFIIVSTSNAVNLTDGLDGLAAGVASIAILGLTGIAYVVSRADWCDYLFLTYVPEASEIFVFGAALLGAGLGFLWFNSHPAEVFMGDTGSLALGGAIGSMAVLTKQELLLPIVAGLFVVEALSVVLQVASFKLTGRRIFRMAPLHHHFELLGWSETKVTMRFYIVAILFALMSLATLKLR